MFYKAFCNTDYWFQRPVNVFATVQIANKLAPLSKQTENICVKQEGQQNTLVQHSIFIKIYHFYVYFNRVNKVKTMGKYCLFF